LKQLTRYKTRLNKSPAGKKFRSAVSKPAFAKFYALICLAVLLATATFWSILGAKTQSTNSDQLVDPYLFSNSNTFHGADWPGAHTFLFKWPLFLLVKLLGYSQGAYIGVTIFCVLLTILVLAGFIYRIERRPLQFGTICLALASVLLMVPAQPTAGGLLPISMAMLASRNLEYALYLAALALLVKNMRLRNWSFWIAVLLLGLLMASDRLFFSMTVGGAVLALLVYALSRGWNMVSQSANWLLAGVSGAILAVAGLWLINSSGWTQISTISGGGPYGAAHNLHSILLGAVYGFLGLLTNFGANPAFDATILRHFPHLAAARLTGIGGLAYLVNLLILIVGVGAGWRLIKQSRAHNRDSSVVIDNAAKISILLIWTAIAALIVFILTDHYFAVDSRYLTIWLFALFLAIAVVSRRKTLPSVVLVVGGLILGLSIATGVAAATKIYNSQQAALTPIAQRNNLIADVLHEHQVKVLVGDYWRVIPIKDTSPHKKMNVMPLSGCTTPRDVLSSGAWRTNLNHNSFAYLLTFSGSRTDYPNCSLDEIIAAYGRPNNSVLIAGKVASPQEVLLFYDGGARNSSPVRVLRTPSTVLPIQLSELPNTTCMEPTTMNVVAHQDDDLLFINPDLLHDIRSNYCIRTVYMTAGDAGHGQLYWLSREQGSEAAYSKMLGSDTIWVNRIVQIGEGEYINVANPRGDQKISLVFIHLPDGSPAGSGFKATGYQSLGRLQNGQINQILSADGQSTYTKDQLTQALALLMNTFQPVEIRTQSAYPGGRITDHSDHNSVSRFVKDAASIYDQSHFGGRVSVPVDFYLGYPVHDLPPNVAGQDLTDKLAVFYTYGTYDHGTCSSDQRCAHTAYAYYLKRMYKNSQ
jgi:LmbE family N-acetylglucosaminyl deacetylase